MSDVKAAAEMLDREIPGWENLVDPAKLEMASCDSCVLGQIFGRKMEQKLNKILDGAAPTGSFDNYFRRGRLHLEGRSSVVIKGEYGPFGQHQNKCEWIQEIADRRCQKEEVGGETVE